MEPNAPVSSTFPPEPPETRTLNKDPLKRKRIIIILIVVAVFILLLIGFLFFNSQKSGKALPSGQIPTPVSGENPSTIVSEFELILIKGEEKIIPNSDIIIVYKDAMIPGPNCADCIAETNILMRQNSDERKLNYLCGGITGQCTDKITEFGYEVEIGLVDEKTAKVKVRKQ